MKKTFTPAIITLAAVLLLSGCGARNYSVREQQVEVLCHVTGVTQSAFQPAPDPQAMRGRKS